MKKHVTKVLTLMLVMLLSYPIAVFAEAGDQDEVTVDALGDASEEVDVSGEEQAVDGTGEYPPADPADEQVETDTVTDGDENTVTPDMDGTGTVEDPIALQLNTQTAVNFADATEKYFIFTIPEKGYAEVYCGLSSSRYDQYVSISIYRDSPTVGNKIFEEEKIQKTPYLIGRIGLNSGTTETRETYIIKLSSNSIKTSGSLKINFKADKYYEEEMDDQLNPKPVTEWNEYYYGEVEANIDDNDYFYFNVNKISRVIITGHADDSSSPIFIKLYGSDSPFSGNPIYEYNSAKNDAPFNKILDPGKYYISAVKTTVSWAKSSHRGYRFSVNLKELIDLEKEADKVTLKSVTYNGKEQGPVVLFDGKVLAENVDYTWSKTDTDKNYIDAGTYNVRLTGMGDYTGSVDKQYEITPKAITPDVTLAKDTFTYDGKTPRLSATVKDKDDNKKLKEGVDYTISYPSGSENAGQHTVTVEMKGNYSGSGQAQYTIKPKSIKNAKVVLKKSSLGYNGKNQTPAVEKISGLTLKEDTDFTVSVQDSNGKDVKSYKSVGKYTLVIKGKGNYTESTKALYEIVKGTNPLKVTAKGSTFSVRYSKLKKKNQTLKNSKIFNFEKNGKGKITYSLTSADKDKKSFKKYFSVSNKGKLTVKKGLKKGSYTVKIKVKAKGNKNYKSSTKTVKFAVKVK
ncbi:MAG: hypothetical protein K6F28_09270 [Lachnospiraceae bacterium]|nr:hypothetical protein [Lachnospiraceae bacterium]